MEIGYGDRVKKVIKGYVLPLVSSLKVLIFYFLL